MFIGFSAVILGVFQITGTIKATLSGDDSDGTDNTLINSTSDDDQLVFLKSKDTDQDGLNDYDELNIYETSPYLADSDGDNITDDVDDDPNCPKGKTCVITPVAGDTNTNSSTNTAVATTDISTSELRTTLKELGAPANIVDAMDDATLRSVYQDTVTDTGIDITDLQGNTNSAVPTDSAGQEITVDALQKLDATQIRQLLISSGVSESDLSQVSDETLQILYTQALQEGL